MLKYEIQGNNLPVVVCYPVAGQSLITQRGAMSWMSPNMQMNTETGGIGKMFSRMVTKESIFRNKYTAQGGDGMIAFASTFPGTIIPLDIGQMGQVIVQKSGFLASEETVELSVYMQKSLGGGLFGGEGFIMQSLTGTGMAFIEIDGSVMEYNLAPGQSLILDTGYLAAMAGCEMDIQSVPGLKNALFGGEGIFNTRVTGGPRGGKVWVQSMPISQTALSLKPYIVSNK